MPLLRNLKLKPEISTKRKYKSIANVSEHMEILETRGSNQHLPLSRNLEWVQKQLMRFDDEMHSVWFYKKRYTISTSAVSYIFGFRVSTSFRFLALHPPFLKLLTT